MQDISENKKLMYLLFANFCVATCLIFDYSEELRDTFELVAYPNEDFKTKVISMLAIDLAWCYILEKACKMTYLKTFENS